MTATSVLIAWGLSVQTYGILTNRAAPTICGSIIYIIGLVVGTIQEDKLNNKIKDLEKELKEVKSNGKYLLL